MEPAPPPPAALLGHTFADPGLLERALTHRSWAYERGAGEGASYERLEFLGDAVLALVAAEWLFTRHPERREGELTRVKGFVVSARALAGHAERVGLGALLRLGVGEERSGGRRKPSLLADALEAVIGAIYLDGGLDAARAAVVPLLADAVADRERQASAASKTELQERLQARGRPLPEYRVVAAEGPDHEKTFTVEVVVDGRPVATASGPSKKVAERRAAVAALAALDAPADETLG